MVLIWFCSFTLPDWLKVSRRLLNQSSAIRCETKTLFAQERCLTLLSVFLRVSIGLLHWLYMGNVIAFILGLRLLVKSRSKTNNYRLHAPRIRRIIYVTVAKQTSRNPWYWIDSTTDCRDTYRENPYCAEWKTRGFCDMYKEQLETYCPKTCGFCISKYSALNNQLERKVLTWLSDKMAGILFSIIPQCS